MKRKTKGINAERELIHLLWAKGWPAVRVAGSGSSRYPSPDILAGNGSRSLAIECKSSGSRTRYLPKEEIENLLLFARQFGAEPWIAMRFNKMQWLFLPAEDLRETDKNYVINAEHAKLHGLILDELIK